MTTKGPPLLSSPNIAPCMPSVSTQQRFRVGTFLTVEIVLARLQADPAPTVEVFRELCC